MPAITIRNLSDETHRALKARAAGRGLSAEAEARRILDDAVTGRGPGFGTRIAHLAAEVGGFDIVIERDREATEPIDFR